MASIRVRFWEVFPSHELFKPPPGFGLRQPSGAFGIAGRYQKAAEGCRTPRRYRALPVFVNPMHAMKASGLLWNRKGARGCGGYSRSRGERMPKRKSNSAREPAPSLARMCLL